MLSSIPDTVTDNSREKKMEKGSPCPTSKLQWGPDDKRWKFGMAQIFGARRRWTDHWE